MNSLPTVRQAGWALLFLVLLAARGFAAEARAKNQPRDAGERSAAVGNSQPVFRFALGGNVAQVPIEVTDNLIFVPVRVNGGEPSWFLLDTASLHSSMDDIRAAALGLAPTTSESNGVRTEILSHPTLDFPGLKVSMAALELRSYTERSSWVGRAVEGVLGADLLGQLAVSIHYQEQFLQFYGRGSFHYRGRGQKLKMQILDGRPAIEAKVMIHGRGTLRTPLWIATGRSESLYFSSAFARAERFATLRERTIPFPQAEHPDGSEDRLGRIRGLGLGKLVLPGALAIFPALSSKKSPGRATSAVGGSMGGAALRRFTVILDFPNQLLVLEPNYSFPNLFLADMSGLVVTALPPGYRAYEVAQVLEKSPAAKAGIAEGDRIEAVDGRPASAYTLDDIRRLLRQDDAEHQLTLRRGQRLFKVTLKLKPLV